MLYVLKNKILNASFVDSNNNDEKRRIFIFYEVTPYFEWGNNYDDDYFFGAKKVYCWYHKFMVTSSFGLIPFLFHQLVSWLYPISIRMLNDIVFVKILHFYHANILFSKSHLYPMKFSPFILLIHSFQVTTACSCIRACPNRFLPKKRSIGCCNNVIDRKQ